MVTKRFAEELNKIANDIFLILFAILLIVSMITLTLIVVASSRRYKQADSRKVVLFDQPPERLTPSLELIAIPDLGYPDAACCQPLIYGTADSMIQTFRYNDFDYLPKSLDRICKPRKRQDRKQKQAILKIESAKNDDTETAYTVDIEKYRTELVNVTDLNVQETTRAVLAFLLLFPQECFDERLTVECYYEYCAFLLSSKGESRAKLIDSICAYIALSSARINFTGKTRLASALNDFPNVFVHGIQQYKDSMTKAKNQYEDDLRLIYIGVKNKKSKKEKEVYAEREAQKANNAYECKLSKMRNTSLESVTKRCGESLGVILTKYKTNKLVRDTIVAEFSRLGETHNPLYSKITYIPQETSKAGCHSADIQHHPISVANVAPIIPSADTQSISTTATTTPTDSINANGHKFLNLSPAVEELQSENTKAMSKKNNFAIEGATQLRHQQEGRARKG